ncbi:unnamed protein product [Lampetra planeri]
MMMMTPPPPASAWPGAARAAWRAYDETGAPVGSPLFTSRAAVAARVACAAGVKRTPRAARSACARHEDHGAASRGGGGRVEITRRGGGLGDRVRQAAAGRGGLLGKETSGFGIAAHTGVGVGGEGV